jgi:hypothetical protein
VTQAEIVRAVAAGNPPHWLPLADVRAIEGELRYIRMMAECRELYLRNAAMTWPELAGEWAAAVLHLEIVHAAYPRLSPKPAKADSHA